jgi:O-antigen ligase
MATSRFSEIFQPRSFLLLALVSAPLACSPLLRDIFNLPTFLVYALLTFAALILAGVKRLQVGTTLDRPLIGMLVVCGISLLFSADRRLGLYGLDRLWLFGGGGIGLLCGALWAGAGLRDAREELLRWTVVAAGLLALFSLVQASGLGPFTSIFENPQQRYGSLLGNPLALGAFLALAVPAVAHFVRQTGNKPAGVAVSVLLVVALALTGARGAWLAALCGLATWAVLQQRLRMSRRWWMSGLLGVVLVAGVAWQVRGRTLTAAADSARLEGWRIAVQEFRDNPWLGLGPANYVYSFRRYKSLKVARVHSLSDAHGHAHNDWLQVAATLGLAGLLLYGWLHWAVYRRLRQVAQEPGAAPLIAGVVALVVQAKFNAPYFAAAWTAALFLGALCAQKSARRWPLVLALLCSGWALFVAGRATVADAADKNGRRLRAGGRPRAAAQAFEAAVALNPDAGAYRFDLANLLIDAAQAVPPKDQPAIYHRMAALGLRGVLTHPLDADMNRLAAEANLFLGNLPEARSSILTASLLDPHFSQTILLDAYIAWRAGDQARLTRLAPHLAEIEHGGHFPNFAVKGCRGTAGGLPPVLWHLALRYGPQPADLACTIR